MDNIYNNYHFTERIKGDRLEFDYRLKKGMVNRKNALRILQYLGYPDEIISGL